MSTNNIIYFLLTLLTLVEISKSLIPIDRYAQSSVLVDKKIYFFGGESPNNGKFSTTLDQIVYLDVSKPFNTANPPFEAIPIPIPFGSSFATAFLDPQNNTIYLFGGITVDANTDKDNFKSVLNSYNLKTNEWTTPKVNGIEPERRREMNGVVDNKTGKFYVFGGVSDQFTGTVNDKPFNDINAFNTVSLIWTKGSVLNVPIPRVDYTATLLPNGIIVFIGGRERISATALYNDVDLSQLSLYDIKADKWSLMTTRGDPVENRNCHSAVLTPDEKIIVFGGRKGDEASGSSVINQLIILDTKANPYEWSIPSVTATTSPPTLSLHSATLVGNYMLVNFGNNTFPIQSSQVRIPFFYILDIRNFTWVTQFEPELTLPVTNIAPINPPTNPAEQSPDDGKKIGIIVGVVGFSAGVSLIAGFLGYKFYKKRKHDRGIPTAGENPNTY